MALQTSGAISLNQIHVEAGGSSGTQASINDSDIRGLISKGSGATMSFSEWYGASNVAIVNEQFNVIEYQVNAEDGTTTVYSGWRFNRNGTVQQVFGENQVLYGGSPSGQSYGDPRYDNWVAPTGGTVGDGFEVFVSNPFSQRISSGSGEYFGTTNQWLRMNTDRSWYLSHRGARNGYTRAKYTVYFRAYGTTTVLHSFSSGFIMAETTD
tara:strand:+ start:2308 stop:2937 length:630 start_codon:yes stop_codon:yes gene_type:complete